MKIVFLGTNGWYTTETGNTPCVLIDSQEGYIVFDAGNGIYKLDKYITEDKPISLFISHFHLDHVSGLQILSSFYLKQGINIYVAEGRKKDFDVLYNPPFETSYLAKSQNPQSPITEIRLRELFEGEQNVGFPVSVVKQLHPFTDHGYKITLEGKTIAYTGDCGLTDGLRSLALNADLLISECSHIDNKQSKDTGHLDPVQAAAVAKEEDVKKLLLTHFSAVEYLSLESRKKAEAKAREIFPETTAAVDDLEITL